MENWALKIVFPFFKFCFREESEELVSGNCKNKVKQIKSNHLNSYHGTI